MNWYTKLEYVDSQTGELISKNEAETNYIINKKKLIRYENSGEYTTRVITRICTHEGKQREIEYGTNN